MIILNGDALCMETRGRQMRMIISPKPNRTFIANKGVKGQVENK